MLGSLKTLVLTFNLTAAEEAMGGSQDTEPALRGALSEVHKCWVWFSLFPSPSDTT